MRYGIFSSLYIGILGSTETTWQYAQETITLSVPYTRDPRFHPAGNLRWLGTGFQFPKGILGSTACQAPLTI